MPAPQRVRVVVAEDEALIRMDLVEMLGEEGYDVVGQCGDGESAVRLAEQLRPDLVMLDVKMPVLDGITAAERIATARIAPVVMLTAFSQRELVERARDAGAMAYLVKPFTRSDLVPAIELAVSRYAELQRARGGGLRAVGAAGDARAGGTGEGLAAGQVRHDRAGGLPVDPEGGDGSAAVHAGGGGGRPARRRRARKPRRNLGHTLVTTSAQHASPGLRRTGTVVRLAIPNAADGPRLRVEESYMTRPTLLRSAVVLGAASLALAACGGSGGGSASSSAASPSSTKTGDGTLTIGTLLPQTGSLAFLGPPEFAGVDLAVQEINAAGGVNGKPIVKIDGDSGDTSTNIASTTVDSQLQKGVDAIVGAASSSVSLTVIDKITSAGVVQFSPANTSIKLSTYPDKGLYFRTAPPDTFQGAILGGLVQKDGHTTSAVLALQDAYGEGLANAFEKDYTAAGGQVVSKIIYDPKAASFEAEVGKTKAANPKSIVLIGFDESKKILQEMIKQGVGPDKVPLYLVDGNLSNTLAEGLPAGIMKGTKGTTPGAKASDEFKKELLAVNPKLTDFSYAPESYDAINMIALAAVRAKGDSGEQIAANLRAISGPNGDKCDDFASCSKLLQEGKDVNYEGKSGPGDLNEVGDPAKATMGIYEFGADNKYTAVDFITGDVPPVTGS